MHVARGLGPPPGTAGANRHVHHSWHMAGWCLQPASEWVRRVAKLSTEARVSLLVNAGGMREFGLGQNTPAWVRENGFVFGATVREQG